MISKEEIIAVAKECNAQERVYKTSPGLDHFLLETAQLECFANHFYEAGAASRDAYIERLETGLLQVRKALCGDIHNTDDLLDLIASRDAEIQRLQMALADAEALELGTAEHCDQLRAELAAVIAACKLKDEALQNCEGMLDELRDYPITHDAIIEALAIQPDDSVLKAWLGEPVAWKHDDPKRHDAITDSVKELLHRANSEYMHRPIDKTEHYTIPLYSPKGLK